MTSELRTRTISGVVLAAVVVVLTWLHPLAFALLVSAATLILWREWDSLTATRGVPFQVGGVVYIGAAALSLVYLRNQSLPILLSVFAIVWTGDIAAYLAGKRWGRHKIAPHISPGKSWEGLTAAIIASAIVGASLGHVAPIPHAILGALLAIIGLLGDLFESSLKRHAGVKDSGTLIPGHGGLFDRVDALLPCAVFSAVALYTRLHLQ